MLVATQCKTKYLLTSWPLYCAPILTSWLLANTGVGNALVYFRPKYLKFRERDSEELRIASLFRTLDLPVPKCLAYSANDFDVDCNDGNTI